MGWLGRIKGKEKAGVGVPGQGKGSVGTKVGKKTKKKVSVDSTGGKIAKKNSHHSRSRRAFGRQRVRVRKRLNNTNKMMSRKGEISTVRRKGRQGARTVRLWWGGALKNSDFNGQGWTNCEGRGGVTKMWVHWGGPLAGGPGVGGK